MPLQEDQLSGNSFIDENHNGLLLLITDLAETIRHRMTHQVNTWSEVQVSANDYIHALEQHFQHEELILKGANYDQSGEHSAKHRKISYFPRTIANKNFDKSVALYFVETARTKVFSHELLEDQEYWSLFENEDLAPPLINWSKKLETDNPEIDEHHHALINYINRLHTRITSGLEQNVLSEELESLYAYSEFHFTEEKKLFELILSTIDTVLHETDHQHLLSDLRIVIDEIKSGTYSVDGLDGYLKYWFLNHIQKFDKPAFKSNKNEKPSS